MDWDEYLAFKVLNRKADQILKAIGEDVMPALDELEVEVDRAVAAIESAKAKIDQLIADGSVSQDQVNALAAKLRTATDSITPAQEGQATAEASAARAGAGEYRNR